MNVWIQEEERRKSKQSLESPPGSERFKCKVFPLTDLRNTEIGGLATRRLLNTSLGILSKFHLMCSKGNYSQASTTPGSKQGQSYHYHLLCDPGE